MFSTDGHPALVIPPPLDRARRYAALVHSRLGVEAPPASAALFVTLASIQVMLADWPADLDGVLLLRDGRATIGLNRHHAPARRHFTFWHEAGHYLLHVRRQSAISSPELRSDGGGWPGVPCAAVRPGARLIWEAEANEFATQVLMPKNWVERLLPETGDLRALARRFLVSAAAMERRLRELEKERKIALVEQQTIGGRRRQG